jgi:curved DNA-binding protein CbpA
MASLDPEMVPTANDLQQVRAQIENAITPFDILGLPTTGPRGPKDIKIAYRTLALQIHPDKCQPGQEELHTRLFAKLQNAYEKLAELQDQIDEDVEFWEKEGSTFTTAGSSRRSRPKKPRQYNNEQPSYYDVYPHDDFEPEPVLRRPAPTTAARPNDSWGGMEIPEERRTADQDAVPKHEEAIRGREKMKPARHKDLKKAKWARQAEKLDKRTHR